MRPNASFGTLKKTFWENFEANARIYENLIFKGIIMVIVSTILYVDMLRFANTFSAQLNDFIIFKMPLMTYLGLSGLTKNYFLKMSFIGKI